MQNLPDNLYSVDSVVRLEQVAINQFDIPAYELMKRAGDAVFQLLKARYPLDKKILVLCGTGNNAGDGYVVARLCQQVGYEVSVISLIDPASLKNEALLAYQDWLSISGNVVADKKLISESEVIVDALLGTGLTRDVSAEWSGWIDAINRSSKPVIAIDLPSGLIADTGVIAGSAIRADFTVCFIGLKQGMFTAQAKDVCGEVIFEDLALPEDVYSLVDEDARLINTVDYSLLPKRKASSHKGSFGHVLIAGGNKTMPGALILAAKAALRSGAGLVTVITVTENLQAISSSLPEVMVKTCELNSVADVFSKEFSNNITHVAVGMGLAQDDWSLAVLKQCVALNKPILLDADALNLMAKHELTVNGSLVITPHPGEARRLLKGIDVQQDRFSSIRQLHDLFTDAESCTVILKGSGTLIFDGDLIKVCNMGSAAMAAPGMGDVLSGIVIALMAQGLNISDAAELAVCLHASAAELVTGDNTRGLLASDIVDELQKVVR